MCYFNAFIDENMFEMMTTETDRYAEQVRVVEPTYFHLADWVPATVQDIKTMLALLFTMGLVCKPDIKSYWSTNPNDSLPCSHSSILQITKTSLQGMIQFGTNYSKFDQR